MPVFHKRRPGTLLGIGGYVATDDFCKKIALKSTGSNGEKL